MTPLSTHDTKRSEDVRARINVLSECPEEWGRRIVRWHALNRSHRTRLEDGTEIPDSNEEYLLYQTLIGSWPARAATAGDAVYIQRIQAYMTKAVREAKLHSSWINPDLEYDAAVAKFVAGILDPSVSAEFLTDFANFQHRIHLTGSVNSLAQTVLRCTVPGVPDTYQGTEFFDDSLVDPDNRRAVDYAARNDSLHGWKLSDIGIPPVVARELGSQTPWDRAKQFLIHRCLRLRIENPLLFERGDYRPLTVAGPDAGHVFAFLRTLDDAAVLVSVPRLMWQLEFDALDAQIRLPDEWRLRRWRNALTNEAVEHSDDDVLPVAMIWNDFPVGVWTT
jgi:(1->4)-alpha-D-glucan 1-alpha-D-glucosylmutase